MKLVEFFPGGVTFNVADRNLELGGIKLLIYLSPLTGRRKRLGKEILWTIQA